MPENQGPTREQQRAQDAFKSIQNVSSQPWAEDYGRVCLRVPALIHQCGLCQTLAFLEAKGAKKPHFTQMMSDLMRVANISGMEAIRASAVPEYQRLSREALRCAQWFKRYAEAILKVEPGKGGGEP